MKVSGVLKPCTFAPFSDFVENSHGEARDSSYTKSWVPVHNQWVPVQKNKESCLGLYVTRKFNLERDAKALYYSLLKLKYSPSTYMCLKHKKEQHAATEITRTGYSTKKSSNWLIVLCVLRDKCHEFFSIFGDYHESGTQDAKVTISLTFVW